MARQLPNAVHFTEAEVQFFKDLNPQTVFVPNSWIYPRRNMSSVHDVWEELIGERENQFIINTMLYHWKPFHDLIGEVSEIKKNKSKRNGEVRKFFVSIMLKILELGGGLDDFNFENKMPHASDVRAYNMGLEKTCKAYELLSFDLKTKFFDDPGSPESLRPDRSTDDIVCTDGGEEYLMNIFTSLGMQGNLTLLSKLRKTAVRQIGVRYGVCLIMKLLEVFRANGDNQN